MRESFDADALERRYAFLDDCPDDLFQEVVTLPVGTLPRRVQGVRAWRDALLDGRLPSEGTWPPPKVAAPARLAVESLDLVRFCKGQPDLVDAVLHDILASFTRQASQLRSDIAARLRELEKLERQRLESEERERSEREHRACRAARVDDATRARLRDEAESEVAHRPANVDEDIVAGWAERTRAWAAISEVFDDLGKLLGRGWDLSIGVLRHSGWTDLVRLRNLVEQLPQLREIVRSLGRLHATEVAEPVAETVFVPLRRLEEERREVWTTHVHGETRGVERSGEIARMLPVEAVNLGHPKLRYSWHARRAERALLTYRVEGIGFERTLVERDHLEAADQRKPRPQRGPIIAVIDTSGSMHGLPERVAKALVLESLRTAHAGERRCFLYAYSGPREVLEHELDLSPEGVGRLLVFLGQSFHGGNDEAGVMAKVVRRLDEPEWTKADVLFVSDGEWPAPASLVRSVEKAREKGARFHGIQIGNRGRTGLHAICDPVHVFQDWASTGGW